MGGGLSCFSDYLPRRREVSCFVLLCSALVCFALLRLGVVHGRKDGLALAGEVRTGIGVLQMIRQDTMGWSLCTAEKGRGSGIMGDGSP